MTTTAPPTLRVVEQDGTVSEVATVETINRAFPHTATRPTDRYLDQYAAWRKSKCKPVNVASIAAVLADLNQATLELVGEVAEACEMINDFGADCFLAGTETRAKFLGEIGDIMFTGSWLGDAWGANPLLNVPGVDATHFLAPETVAKLEDFRVKLHARILASEKPLTPEIQWVRNRAFEASVVAGLLCNACKKAVYQRRSQDVALQVDRVNQILQWAAWMAVLADATVTDALANNIKKLDHRYPLGYQGPGGGNRTGVGA